MSEPSIVLRTNPPFGEIILNQPGKRNALSSQMWAAIPDLIREAEMNEGVKVLLIHGGEAGAFAAGADISEFEAVYATRQSAEAAAERIAAALNAVEGCTKPVIAAIEGACVGGGVSLAAAADLRVAAEGARFGVTPGKLGLVYAGEDTRRLIRLVGVANTKDILFTARLFQAEEALTMGLINRLSPRGEALGTARSVGEEMAALSQWSVRATKAMIAGLQSGWDGDGAEARALHLDGFTNEDFTEGYRAFLQKRPPKFSYS